MSETRQVSVLASGQKDMHRLPVGHLPPLLLIFLVPPRLMGEGCSLGSRWEKDTKSRVMGKGGKLLKPAWNYTTLGVLRMIDCMLSLVMKTPIGYVYTTHLTWQVCSNKMLNWVRIKAGLVGWVKLSLFSKFMIQYIMWKQERHNSVKGMPQGTEYSQWGKQESKAIIR